MRPGMDARSTMSARDLCRAIVAGHDALRAHERVLNRLNVFPVADGDTGTNMAATLGSVRHRLADGMGMAATCEAMRSGSLMGARGNSGIILSQILRGLADILEGQEEATGPRLADALGRARTAAWSAVVEPVEGPILTVVTAAAAAADAAARREGSPADVAGAAAGGAREALRATTALLPALAAAGVVDAGGAGLSLMLDALALVVAGEVPPSPEWAEDESADDPGPAPDGNADGSHEYEVICLLHTTGPAVDALRRTWAGLGTSVATVGGSGLWNCHVHTDDPEGALAAAHRAGRPEQIQVTPLRRATPGGAGAGGPDHAEQT
jgi:hypothetical protein